MKENKSIANKKRFINGNWEVLAVLVITLIVYIPALQNNFLIWDDDTYVIENPDIKHTNFNTLKNIFTTSYNKTFIPVTILSWSLDYKIAGLHPWLYILNNLLLHLANTFLVYLLLFRLFKRRDIALVTALLFGIHPVHVESVVWITERKDVLFTFFFLLSSLKYLKYIEEKNINRGSKGGRANLFYSMLFFMLSVLSKGQAVALAPTLFIYDYIVTGKLFNKKLLGIKIPYLIIAVGAGILALYFQSYFDGSHPVPYSFTTSEKLVLTVKAFTAYIFMYFWPLNLSAIYPLPNPGTGFPALWNLYFIPFIIFLMLTVWPFFKKKKLLAFSLGFFWLNIFLLLDHSAIGKSLFADRFLYVSSIGLSLLVASVIVLIPKYFKYGLISALIISLSYATFSRTTVWRNEIVLFTDAISKYPENPQAYNELGRKYYLLNNFGKAEAMFKKGLHVFPGYPEILNNLAVLRIEEEKYTEALLYLDQIPANAVNETQMLNRSIIYFHLGKYDEAIAELYSTEQLSSKPSASLYTTKGMMLEKLNKNRDALGFYNKAIELDPDFYKAYLGKATMLIKMQDFKHSEENFQKAMALKPNDPQIMHGYASLKGQYQNDLETSMTYLNRVTEVDPNYYRAYLDKGIIFSIMNDPRNAMMNLNKCISLKPDYSPAYVNRAMIFLNLDRNEEAYNDLLFAKQYGGNVNEQLLQQLEAELNPEEK